jgi:HAD superfamily hydrolase (TIGR01509 family)
MPSPENSIQAVLFDWDGTLLDSWHADSTSYLAAFTAMGIPFTLDDLARHYSPNGFHVYRAAQLPRARWPAANRAWRKEYANHKPKLVPGALGVLTQIARRYQLGLVTSGDRDRVLRQLRDFRLGKLFASQVCGTDTKQKKPHPAPLRRALREMGLKPSACIYVGDSPHDLEMATRAGVRSIAIIGCFPTEKSLRAANPEVLLESLSQLPDALKRLQNLKINRQS